MPAEFDALKVLLESISSAVLGLRGSLEKNDLNAIPQALELAQQALDSINRYHGGIENLKLDINSFDEERKHELMVLLESASVNHQINGELIKLATQRSAAMQSFIAQQAPGATYGADGGVPGSVGGVLSRRV
jgi:hypothetical protein